MKSLKYLLLLCLGLIICTFSSCDEDGELDLTVFSFDWKTQNSSMSLESIHSQLANPPSTLTSGSLEYTNLRPDAGNLNSSKINVYGSPPSNLDILITREPSADELNATAVKIYILEPLVEGETYTEDSNPGNLVEMYFGDGATVVYSTKAGSDTYFELTIDRLDPDTRRISGSFFFALRNEDNPYSEESVIGFNGDFDWIY